jgi:TolB-like protein
MNAVTKEKIRQFLLTVFLMTTATAGVSFAKDEGYDKMAEDFSKSASLLNPPKIAIIPFTYVDKRKSDGGMIVSERLMTRIVKLKKLQVIERGLLESVMQELKLQESGVVDAETTKKLGKILGVTAIITGTLLDIEEGMVEINARIINTETAEVLDTSAVEIRKVWSDVSTNAPAPAQPVYQQQMQAAPEQPYYAPPQPVYQQPYRPARKINGFVEFFTGSGGGKMDLLFNNSVYIFSEKDLSFNFDGDNTLSSLVGYKKISFKGLTTESAAMPIGFRFGVFGENFGGGMEISYSAQRMIKQKTTVSYNDGASRSFEFTTDDYMSVKTFVMAWDLMYQFSNKKIRPYIGFGIGLAFNTISSQWIYGYTGSVYKKPLDEFAVGFQTRIPLGVRISLNDQASLFLEYRSATTAMTFDRGVKYEDDTLSISTNQFLFGLNAAFGSSGQVFRNKGGK